MLLALFVLFDAVAIAIIFKWSKSVFTASAFCAAISTEVCYLNLFPCSLLIFTIYLLYIAIVFAAVAVWFYLSTQSNLVPGWESFF